MGYLDMEESCRKEKAPPFSYDEKLTLVKLIKENPVILDKAGENFRKKMAWEDLTQKLNSLYPFEPRTTAQLKQSWATLKLK